jgi:hypothetical protein
VEGITSCFARFRNLTNITIVLWSTYIQTQRTYYKSQLRPARGDDVEDARKHSETSAAVPGRQGARRDRPHFSQVAARLFNTILEEGKSPPRRRRRIALGRTAHSTRISGARPARQIVPAGAESATRICWTIPSCVARPDRPRLCYTVPASPRN